MGTQIPRDGCVAEPPATNTITTTSTEILSADTDRIYVRFHNLGNRDVFVAFAANAAIDNGGVVIPKGEMVDMPVRAGVNESVNMKVAAGTSTVATQVWK